MTWDTLHPIVRDSVTGYLLGGVRRCPQHDHPLSFDWTGEVAYCRACEDEGNGHYLWLTGRKQTTLEVAE